MKKRLFSKLLSIILAISLLSTTLCFANPINVFASNDSVILNGDTDSDIDSETDTPTDTERTPSFILSTNKPDSWGGWNGGTATYTEGAAEDGISSAYVISGGANGGGIAFSLNVGGGASQSSNYTYSDNSTGKLSGYTDATDFFIRYKSESNFTLKFQLEFRASKSPTLVSKGVTVPSSNGEWATAVIPFSAFAPEGTKWTQSIYGKYTSNFEPVVMLRFENVNLASSGKEIVVDNLGAYWYEEDMVSSATLVGQKKSYFQYYDNFDYSQGKIEIKRFGTGDTVVEEIALDDPRVTISGFQNTTIKNDPTESKNTKITVTVLNKTLTYYIRVVPFAPPTLTNIEVVGAKTDYYVGDPFDYTTGKIVANYSDKDPEEAALNDKNTVVTGFNSSTPGTKTITVTYGAKSYNYDINVREFSVDGITDIILKGMRTSYKVGDKFFWHGGTITPVINGSNATPVPLYNNYVKITGFDSSAPAQDQEITVTYSGISKTYKIDIINGEHPVLYYAEMNMGSGSQPSLWYHDKNSSSFVAGAGEDGVSTGWSFTGKGTAQTALMNWGSSEYPSSNGKTVTGLVGADAISLRYKSDKDVTMKFYLEYRASKSPTKSSVSVTFPATSGEWSTYTVPMSMFEPAQTGESHEDQIGSVDWIYNKIKGGYTTNFEPVVKLYVGTKLAAGESTIIDNIRALWYDEEALADMSISDQATAAYEDQPLDMSQGKVTISYKNGSTKDLNLNDTSLNVETTETDTSYDVTVSYGSLQSDYSITKSLITGIQASGIQEYYQYQEFDYDSGSLTITYDDETSRTIPLSDENIIIEGFDSNELAENQVVTISYFGHETQMLVNIVAGGDVVKSLVINDARTVYLIGDEFTYDGTITVTYQDNTTTTINLTDEGVTIEGFDSSAASNNQTITVTYGGVEQTYRVRIYAPATIYSNVQFLSSNGSSISSFSGAAPIKASVSARNPIGTECPQVGYIMAVGYNNATGKVVNIKFFNGDNLAASATETLEVEFDTEELKSIDLIKVIGFKKDSDLEPVFTTVTSIPRI